MAAHRGGSLAQRVRYSLLGLEDKDLEQQATWGLRSIIGGTKSAKDLKCIVKDLLTGLENTSASARRHRYLLAGYAVESSPADAVPQIVPFIMTKVNRRLGEEKQQSAILAVGQLVEQSIERVMVHMVDVMNGRAENSKEFSHGWLANSLVHGLIKAATKSPDKNKVTMAFAVLHGIISALRDWTHVPGVVPTVLFCFRNMVQAMLHGLFGCRVAGAYLPLQRCMEILGVHAPPETVGTAIKVCLMGAKDRDDWQVRRSAMETLTVIAAAVQIHEKSEEGEWVLKMSDGLVLLSRRKPEIMKVLVNAKYDKILHVRKAATATKAEMDHIPDPDADDNPPLRQTASTSSVPTPGSTRRSTSYDGRPTSGNAFLRSRSCDVTSGVPPVPPQRKQRSRRDSRSVDMRRPASVNVLHQRSASRPDSVSGHVDGDRGQKRAVDERQRRQNERKARQEDLRMALRRAKSAKSYSRHDGHDYEVQVFVPERQCNRFEAFESEQRCPSAPPLRPVGSQPITMGTMLVEGPSTTQVELHRAQSQLGMNGNEHLAAWVSSVQGAQKLDVKVSVDGRASQHSAYLNASVPTGNQLRCDSQGSDEGLSLRPPSLLNAATGSRWPSTSSRSAQSTTMATLLDGSEAKSPGLDTTLVLEPASPPSPWAALDRAGKHQLKSHRLKGVGKSHNMCLKQANAIDIEPFAAADRELSQVRHTLEDVILHEEAANVHGTDSMIQRARSTMAQLTLGSTGSRKPEAMAVPSQSISERDKGGALPKLARSAELVGLRASGRVNPVLQASGKNLQRGSQNDSDTMHCGVQMTASHPDLERSDTAEKLEALDSMSESSVDFQSPERKTVRWKKAARPSRPSGPEPNASPEEMLNYTIATLKQCMKDLPKTAEEQKPAARAASEGVTRRVGYPGSRRSVGACQEDASTPLLQATRGACRSPASNCKPLGLGQVAREHTDGVLHYYRTREHIQLQFLEEQYQRNIANMEAMFEREKAFLRSATQKAIKEEVSLFSRTYMPHVANVVTGRAKIDAHQTAQGDTTRIG